MSWAIVGFIMGWTFTPSNFKKVVALVPRVESQHGMAEDTASNVVHGVRDSDHGGVVLTPAPTPGVSHD